MGTTCKLFRMTRRGPRRCGRVCEPGKDHCVECERINIRIPGCLTTEQLRDDKIAGRKA